MIEGGNNYAKGKNADTSKPGENERRSEASENHGPISQDRQR